jgi:hypothetical protein
MYIVIHTLSLDKKLPHLVVTRYRRAANLDDVHVVARDVHLSMEAHGLKRKRGKDAKESDSEDPVESESENDPASAQISDEEEENEEMGRSEAGGAAMQHVVDRSPLDYTDSQLEDLFAKTSSEEEDDDI